MKTELYTLKFWHDFEQEALSTYVMCEWASRHLPIYVEAQLLKVWFFCAKSDSLVLSE